MFKRFKRQKRFQWPAHENLVQIPPDLPIPKPVFMAIDMATGEDYTATTCALHGADFAPKCPFCQIAKRLDHFNKQKDKGNENNGR